MDPAVRTLFQELAGLSTEEREEIYRKRTIDHALRAEVESLLRFDSTSSPLADDPVDRVIGDVLRRLEEGEELMCGPYRLIKRIGKGGMGAVYLGERVDGELRQQAAVKLLRADADFDAWRPHFLRERQMLADLNHPAIARLLDAGHTPDGRPYLVMEYVDGVPIDAYAKDLGFAARLRLFVKVCEGVAHAHRRLVIHRDLKPSNILVDESGAVKLLDFGIARLVGPDEPVTQTIDRFLTPEYASPEQWRGAAQTTATDVYSLGAVLCRLLTGEPPRLSSDESLPTDVRFILRKALRQEPEQRYGSVDALAADIEAYLDNRPVAARAGDRWYRIGKFVRRHRVPVSAAAAILIAVGAAFWAVNRERAIAEQRFQEVRQLAGKLFEIDRQVRALPGAAKARQYIVETSLDYLRRLEGDATHDPDLALDLGTAYFRVGRVQGVPVTPNLGDAEAAERSLKSAEKLIGDVLAAEPGNRTALLRAAQIAHDRMILAQGRHPNTEALPLARRSNEWLQKYLASGEVEDAEKDQVMIAGMNVANWLGVEHQFDEALALLRQTIDFGKRTNQMGQAGAAHIALARTLRRMGDLDGALAAIRESVRLLEPTHTGTSPTLGVALATQGDILGQDGGVSLGRPREAAAFYERAFRLATEAARQDPANAMAQVASASRGRKLADVMRRWDARAALAVYDEGLAELAGIKNNPKVRRDEVGLLAGSAVALAGMGRAAEARTRLEGAFERLRDLKMYPAEGLEPEVLETLMAQAEVEPGRAIGICEELLAKLKAETVASLDDANEVSRVYEALAAAYRKAGREAEASETERRRRDLWREWEKKLPVNAFVRRQLAN